MKRAQLFRVLRKGSERLQNESESIYFQILSNVASQCSAYSWFDSISEPLRLRDVSNLLRAADSLATQSYSSATEHFVANQFAALVRKMPFSPEKSGLNPEANARRTFLASERKCGRVNRRFRLRRVRRKAVPYTYEIDSMSKFVSYVLGDSPDIDSILDRGGFGPGASIGVNGNATNAARKILAKHWTVSPGAYMLSQRAVLLNNHLRRVLQPSFDGFSSGLPVSESEAKAFRSKTKVCDYNKITFVPKTAKTLRSIAVEPLLNGYVQKGIDLHMRDRLKRVGVDLSSQERNREMARLGSLDSSDESFVTIDLSSASDSIATEVVREILPPDWFYLLNSTRSHNFQLDGVNHRFEKFCSMGNGFCFPLETLIFVSACVATKCGRPYHDFMVYGDDIIVRKRNAKALIALLGYLGFKVNVEKTYLDGPFRESCGSDWYHGKDVRPFTLDFDIHEIQDIFKVLNLSKRSELTRLFFENLLDFLVEYIPPVLRFYRPRGQSNPDTGIDCELDFFLTTRNCRWNTNLQCYSWKELSNTPTADVLVKWADRELIPLALLWGALTGSASSAPFVKRRGCRSRILNVSHGGSHSTWVPASCPL